MRAVGVSEWQIEPNLVYHYFLFVLRCLVTAPL